MLPRLETADPPPGLGEEGDDSDDTEVGCVPVPDEALTPNRTKLSQRPSAYDVSVQKEATVRGELATLRAEIGWIESELRRREYCNKALTKKQRRRVKYLRQLTPKRLTDRSLCQLCERKKGLLRIKRACLAEVVRKKRTALAEIGYSSRGPQSLEGEAEMNVNTTEEQADEIAALWRGLWGKEGTY